MRQKPKKARFGTTGRGMLETSADRVINNKKSQMEAIPPGLNSGQTVKAALRGTKKSK